MVVSAPTPLASRAGSSARLLPRMLVSALMTGAVWLIATRAMAQTPTPIPHLHAHLTTNRGCLETGDTATFAIGERVIVFLSVDSATLSTANATLFAIKPDGFVSVFGLGALMTNMPFALVARVGQPSGVHELQLRASAGAVTSVRSCSFDVMAAPITRTPPPSATPTQTPTPTETPTVSSTPPTATPAAALRPHITTNRGCEETGQHPTFSLGEPITVSFDIASDVLPRARATLFDILPNGFVNVLPFRTVATNHTVNFHATIAPPMGLEVLQLRASAFGVPSASSFCSFFVMQ